MENRLFGQTDTGKVRDNNEDAFLAEPIAGGTLLLACVIDGVGGYEGGEVAAAIAQEGIRKNLNRLEGGQVAEALPAAIRLANQEIYRRKEEDALLKDMACVLTLVVADPENNQFYYAHVGDTRLYLLRDGALVKITRDQSFVGFLEESGRLTETEAMRHPKRNEINQALGLEDTDSLRDDFIETGHSPFLPGDILLLCSDGLTDRIGKERITDCLLKAEDLSGAVRFLIDEANDAGGNDNITVVLVRNDKTPVRHEPARTTGKQNSSEAAPAAAITVPVVTKVVRNRGWLILLSLLSVALLGVSAWLYLQLDMLRKHQQRPVAPVYENPWQPLQAKRESLKIPLKDTVYYTDPVSKPLKPHAKDTSR